MNEIKKLWKDFWYESDMIDSFSYGGTCEYKYRFREERLIGVVITIIVLLGYIL